MDTETLEQKQTDLASNPLPTEQVFARDVPVENMPATPAARAALRMGVRGTRP